MLTQIRSLRLPIKGLYTSVSDDGRRLVVYSRDGICRLFDDDLRQLDEIEFEDGAEWVKLDESGSQLLVGHESHIDAYTTLGNFSHSFRLAAPGTSTVDCCVFKSDERVLCVASLDKTAKLSAWDIASRAIIAEKPLPCGNWAAGYELVSHPEGEAMVVAAYSGQSEELAVWAHYARGCLKVYDSPQIADVAIPCFHPTGREFVSHHETLGLCRVRFPTGELITSVPWQYAFPDNPDYEFSYQALFSRDDRVLVWQAQFALYEFDLDTLLPVRTVLAGADGKTFGEHGFYSGSCWRMAGNRLLTSDYQHEPSADSLETLRLWDASSLFGPMSRPDLVARPYTTQLLAGGE